jgi:type I restriction enzyme S subunit
MKETENRGRVPRLRFPEFREAGEWSPKTIDETCVTFSGGTPITSNKEFYGGSIPFIRSAEIGRDQTELFLSRKGLLNSSAKMVQKGDVLIALYGANSGDVALAKISGSINQAILCVQHESNNAFVYNYLYHKKDWIVSTYIQGGQGNLSCEIIKSINLSFPSSSEQQKIADCLASLDELLTLEAQKLDTLKTHKKGLMQQLFPAEGETLPKLRFPEFRNADEWEQKSIGQLGEVVTGSTPSTAQPEFYGGERLFVSPADISDDRFIKKTKTTLTEPGFRETRPIKANSILFVCIGSTIGKIAQNRYECATNQQINSVIPNSENSNGFVYYALSGIADKIANLAGKQAVPIVKKSLFSSVELTVPKLPEQNRIAICLSSLDELILAQTQKLEALKTHKKGLMQQLFPSPEAAEA